jgi:hypothetical protein
MCSGSQISHNSLIGGVNVKDTPRITKFVIFYCMQSLFKQCSLGTGVVAFTCKSRVPLFTGTSAWYHFIIGSLPAYSRNR